MIYDILFRTTPFVVAVSAFTVWMQAPDADPTNAMWFIACWAFFAGIITAARKTLIDESVFFVPFCLMFVVTSVITALAVHFLGFALWDAFKFSFLYTLYAILAGISILIVKKVIL